MQIEDFSDLTKVSEEKLVKLRDVALDHFDDMDQAATAAWERYSEICEEISKRRGEKSDV